MPNPTATASSYEQSLQDRIDHLEQALATCEQQLEHAQRLATLGTTAAGLAHEINNLLTPVVAYAQLAQSDPEDIELLQKAVQKAAMGAESATQLASTMLDFSRPGEGASSARANVNAAVGRAIQCLVRDPSKDGITCKYHIDEAIYVRMQPLALQQVILNLLLNAVKALKGQPQRVLTIEAERVSGERAAIHVCDTGPGLPAGLRQRLFEPFIHAGTGSSRGGGEGRGADGRGGRPGACDWSHAGPLPAQTGLGLAICHRLVSAAGGSIAVETSPGQGTVFTITVPATGARDSSSKNAA